MADGGGRGGNLIALGLGQAARLGSGLVVNVLLMRLLGLEGFGIYGTVITVLGLAAFGTGLGMNRLINRELAREPEHTASLVGAGLVGTLGLSLLTGLAVVAATALLDGRPLVVAASGLGAVAMGLQALAAVPEAAIHARQRMALSTRGHVAGRVTLMAGTAGLLLTGVDLLGVFAAQILDGVVTLGVVAHAYRVGLGEGWVRPSAAQVRTLVRRALPFGLNLLFGSLYLSVDVLLLAWLRDDREVGIYRGAVMLIALFPVLANVLSNGIYPRMARHIGDRQAAGRELGFALRMLLALSVPTAVGALVLAEPLMVFLGGETFAVSAASLMVMAPLLPLRFVNNASAMTLSTLNRQDDRTGACSSRPWSTWA